VTNVYTENFNGKHSPILGWVEDGYPVYGPYGFSDPNDPNSGVRRMLSGYRKRNLANGAPRNSLPQWVVTLEGRSTTIPANLNGPNVSNAFPVGHYLEDYEYLGDVGFTKGTDFDLDEHNVRFCVTPEFPGGTYAYFTAIEADGTPIYPYNIGRSYFGNPTGGNANSVPAGAEIYFEGGPERPVEIKSVSADKTSGDVVLTWSAAEGGSYRIEASPDGGSWTDLPVKVNAGAPVASLTDSGRAGRETMAFYNPETVSLLPFDDAGFVYDNSVVKAAAETITIFLTNGEAPPPPANLNVLPDSITFDGQPVVMIGRPSQYAIEIEIDPSQLADGDYTLSATFAGSGTWTGVFSHVGNPNILLLIVDDWGTDSSPIDNNTTDNLGTTFPTMANLEALAAGGVRFTNGYSQPVCSPTRAALLTGRQAFRTGVGAPGDAINAAETTLPEAFAADSSPFALASFGKWHLGGNATGYSTLGGWPHFVGITGGGVQDFYDWPKNTNGTTADTTTYSTTDQVNEAKSFIDTQETAGNPWFVWMGFNAPHTPFHDPPANLLQGGAGTSNRALYEKALEALDTEIGRLLQSVDLAKTTVIIVGDNGTPGQVVQAPYGNGHAKDDLYEGGIHVPFVVRGPSVKLPAGSTSDRFVQVADLFPTILEIAGVTDPGTGTDGTSIVPILEGNDSTERTVVAEKISTESGRSLRSEAFPDHKLIIFGDPNSTSDTPTFEFYNLASDENEEAPLNIAGLTGSALDAYNHLIAKDAALGGGYSAPATGPEDTLYIELPNTTGPASPPSNMALNPTSITVDGVAATYVSRVDQNEAAQRYWVKCVVPEADPYTSATVTFSDNPNTGDPRVFNSIQIIVAP
jgi:arylsulfatase A-like enzyme